MFTFVYLTAGRQPQAHHELTAQVALNQSALAEDGSAAKIQASGSNKAKLRDGTASFVAVSVAADAPGQYTLRAASASRKHSMEDATMALQLASSNSVTAITVAPELPPTGLHHNLR